MGAVGIEKAHVYPTTMALDMRDLCEARSHDQKDILEVMMIDERSVAPPWEDPVTLAVNAAKAMLTEEDRASIELLIVGSESGVDQEKALSTWVHRFLELPPQCRNFELKQACYSGTAGLMMAASWVASGVAPGKKALVITTDLSRMHLHQPYEFVMGAGAAALLVSAEPELLELELGKSGYFTQEVSDLFRPTSTVEQGNSETSLLSYLEGLEGALAHFLTRIGEPIDYEAYFKKNIYHVPFGGITLRAHRTAMRQFGPVKKKVAENSWWDRTRPSLDYTRRMGGTYASSTFIALLSLIDRCPELAPGDRIGIFSYGSGSCAEFYSARVGARAQAVAAQAEVKRKLDRRRRLTVREYEEAERERTLYVDRGDFSISTDGFGGWYSERYEGRKLLVFRGAEDFYRQYGWS